MSELYMNPEIRTQWCKALRSGEYTQAQKALRVGNEDGTYGYCCLGVLTDLYLKAGNPEDYRDEESGAMFNVWDNTTLPAPVMDWADLSRGNPYLHHEEKGYLPAGEWNDFRGASFADIADMIEGKC